MNRASLIVSFAILSIAVKTAAETTFYKQSDMIDVVTTDHSSGKAYLLFEDSNKKQRIELCTCNHFSHHNWRHARFRLSPTVNSSSICIYADGQFFKFPMPTYQNVGNFHCSHEHGNAIVFNEFELKDLSGEEPALEITFRSFDGTPEKKSFSGKDAVGGLFDRLGRLLSKMRVDTAPQPADVFGDGEILVTKSDIIELQVKVKSVISAYKVKAINAASATSQATPNQSTDPFAGTGSQGKATFDFSRNDGVFTIQSGNAVFKTKWSGQSAKRIRAHAHPSQKVGGRPEFTVFPPSSKLASMLDYSAPTRSVAVGEVVVFQTRDGKALAVKILDIKDKKSGASENGLSIAWKLL